MPTVITENGSFETKTLEEFMIGTICLPETLQMLIARTQAVLEKNEQLCPRSVAHAAIVCLLHDHTGPLLMAYDYPVIDFGKVINRIASEIETYLGCGHA